MDMQQLAGAQLPGQPDQPDQVAVTITKEGDGTFTVEPETDEDPQSGVPAGPESQAIEGQEAGQAKKVRTIDEALQMAKTMLMGGDQNAAMRNQIAQQVFGGRPA